MARKTPTSPQTAAEALALRSLFEQWAKSRGYSQERFGQEFKIGGQAMVWQYLHGHRPLNLSAALKFAKGLEVEIREFSPRLAKEIEDAMITGTGALVAGGAQVQGSGIVHDHNAPERERRRAGDRIPIVGLVVASPHGDGYFTDGDYPVGHGEAYVNWPSTDPNAYAVRVRGDSMQPRARPGEVIVVEPNRTPQAGEDVIVRCRDGRKMIKQLLWQRDGEVTLGSINSTYPNVTIQLTDIESLHLIAAIVQRPTTREK